MAGRAHYQVTAGLGQLVTSAEHEDVGRAQNALTIQNVLAAYVRNRDLCTAHTDLCGQPSNAEPRKNPADPAHR
ncbi:hypothetical protein GCM10011574_67980 [Microbispora bryophytorum]|uniref:Uncharacterized protein n=1 Tax=Microbispora bryophytorum TaxID=1460882 RepID=A0A8H9H5H9_9ACTN|nr:hypothetical protein GCM10011574_67980 [Microbispora bryophytorum]